MEEAVIDAISELDPFDLRCELFKRHEFDFIVTGKNEYGETRTHEIQRKALEILTSGEYAKFLYGGAAGGAKTWTGCTWMMFMAAIYPDTRWFIARNRLTDLVDSVLVTFKKVCNAYGFDDYKFDGQKYKIKFGNGSEINLIEVKYQPSDPLFEDLGSTEYTGGWIEEIGETHPLGATVLHSRCGRHNNVKYGIKKITFYTCNPKKNWGKMEFYDKHIAGTLEPNKYFLQALVTDNPFISQDYVESLRELKDTNPSLYKRLYLGDWNYEDNPNQIPDDDMIDAMFENNHVKKGTAYITCDVARFGSDKAVIGLWRGWQLVEIWTLDVSKTTDIELLIRTIRFKHKIPKLRAIGDEDGVGGGVVDGAGINGFKNNGRPIKLKGQEQNYRNLQVQCLYKLAEKINNAEIWVSADITAKEKQMIKEEMQEIQSKNRDDRKLDLKPKSEIRESIGRSPDYRDMMLMRVWFDLTKKKRRMAMSKPRQVV